MKIDAKILALVVVVMGAAIVVAYNMGEKQSASQSQQVASAPQAQPGTTTNAAPAATAPVETKTLATSNGALPPNHPAMGNSAHYTHFRVGNRNVKAMLADGEYVWVGTSGGAIRYDLKTDDYKLFDVNNHSLISNGVFSISKLRGKVFVGTYGGGMSVFDPATSKWKNYNIPNGLADQFVYDIAEDPQGNYWVATWSGANYVADGKMDDTKAWKTYTVKSTHGGLPNDWVYGVDVGQNGDVWFATEGGLARRDKNGKWTNWQHKDGLGANYDVVKDSINYTHDPAKASRHHAMQKAEQGLKDVKVGYNPNYIVSMVVDKQGVVWCGTWGGGLSRFDGKTWKTYTTKDGLPGNHVFMLKISKDGKMWIGTNKGLAIPNADMSGFKVMTKAQGLYADNVFSMTEAQDGSLWVGSFGGVARLSNYTL